MRFDLISAIGLIAFLVFMGIFAFILQRYLSHKANSGHDIYLSDLDGPTYAVLVGALVGGVLLFTRIFGTSERNLTLPITMRNIKKTK